MIPHQIDGRQEKNVTDLLQMLACFLLQDHLFTAAGGDLIS